MHSSLESYFKNPVKLVNSSGAQLLIMINSGVRQKLAKMERWKIGEIVNPIVQVFKMNGLHV